MIKTLSLSLVKEGDEIMVKDSTEVVLPSYMKDMLSKSHSTHLSERGLKEIFRGKLWWYNMSKNIKNLYESCKECKINSVSKINPETETVPEDL